MEAWSTESQEPLLVVGAAIPANATVTFFYIYDRLCTYMMAAWSTESQELLLVVGAAIAANATVPFLCTYITFYVHIYELLCTYMTFYVHI